MKRILLTTTSLVLVGGLASAETSISWSGKATAGIAREGKVAGVASQNTANILADLAAEFAVYATKGSLSLSHIQTTSASVEATMRSDIAAVTAAYAANGVAASNAAMLSNLATIVAVLDAGASTAVTAKATSDFETYSEVNATVTGTVSMDNGMTLSAGMSVDAGSGYDFADDDGFDAAKTNGVGLDSISLNAGAMGTIKIDQNAVTHLVDGDDDGNADVLYTNTFGSLSFSAAIDMATDVDDNAVKAVAAVIADSATGSASITDTSITTAAVAGVAADVQWSAKVSMPVSGGTAYVAMDEEGGNAFGASTTVSGFGVSFDSKLEALEEGLSMDRSNTLGLTYVMGAVTAGATWNSIEDGDQWGISASYAGADGLSISASTDEGSDWSVSGSYALGSGASVVGGVNYTEDAYVGVSFAF